MINLLYKIASATAAEVKATGLDWTFAPCVAVARMKGGVYESFSEDSDIVTELGVASTIGYQGRNLNKKSVSLRKTFCWKGIPYLERVQTGIKLTEVMLF